MFSEILEILYNYEFETEPEYNKIIFLFEKILLDMNIVPSSNNFDWIENNSTFPNNNDQIHKKISDESRVLLELELLEINSSQE